MHTHSYAYIYVQKQSFVFEVVATKPNQEEASQEPDLLACEPAEEGLDQSCESWPSLLT